MRILLLLPFLLSVQGHAEEFPCSLKTTLPSFTLSARPTCRASIEVQGHSQNVKVCLSEEQWRAWLQSHPAPSLCGTLTGRWKLSAYLAEGPLASAKELHSTFRLTALPSHTTQSVPAFWKKIQSIRESFSQRLKNRDRWGIFRAMILGERDSNAPLDFLRLIGFFHLFNASGVHLYALAASVGWIIGSMLLAARVSAQGALRTSRALTAFIWLWAWILCGCRPGMLRPIFVVAAGLSARTLGFRWRYWAPFILSFALELGLSLVHGKTFINESRLEVALAVGGFLMVMQGGHERRGTHALALIGGWIFVGLVQAFHTGLISLSAPVLGFLTLPIFCSLTYPWLLMESVFGFSTSIGDFLIKASFWTIHRLTELALSIPSLWLLSKATLCLSVVLGLVWMLLSFCLSRRAQAMLLVCVFFGLIGFRFRPLAHRQNDPSSRPLALDVIQLDVGQGDSALVLGDRPGLAGLIDAGSAHSLNDAQWVRVLARDQVARLDWIGLTHLDEDHRGGIDRLSRLIPITCIASSRQEVQSERGQALARKFLARGIRLVSWEAGCVPYPVFKPRENPKAALHHAASGNLQMSALLVPLKSGNSYLSAGDAEGRDEIPIMRWADELSARFESPRGKRILKVSHHGSRTSSDPIALRLFHPDVAVISVGLGNSFGHPTPEILARLSEMKIPVHRTDLMGPFRAEVFLRRPQEHLP